MSIRNVSDALLSRATLINRVSLKNFVIPKRGVSDVSYYDTLGVDRNATRSEITKAYLKAGLQFTPKKNPGKFAAAASAYNCLSNYESRKLYDRGLLKASVAAPDLIEKYSKEFASLYKQEQHSRVLQEQTISPREKRQRKYLFTYSDPNAERVSTARIIRGLDRDQSYKNAVLVTAVVSFLLYFTYKRYNMRQELKQS